MAGIEGCLTDHVEIGRVDIIYPNATFRLGMRLGRSWAVYWGAGLGELLADATPSDVERVKARPAASFGPGVTWTPWKYLAIDFSVYGIVFGGFDFGTFPKGGSRLGIVPSLMVAVQI